eukprot:440366-Rhodomonas_salina.1
MSNCSNVSTTPGSSTGHRVENTRSIIPQYQTLIAVKSVAVYGTPVPESDGRQVPGAAHKDVRSRV